MGFVACKSCDIVTSADGARRGQCQPALYFGRPAMLELKESADRSGCLSSVTVQSPLSRNCPILRGKSAGKNTGNHRSI